MRVRMWAGMLIAALALPRPVTAAEAQTPEAPPPSTLATEVAAWVVASKDSRRLPFAIVDKSTAEVRVYTADGRLRGAAPALLGVARGDRSVPGIGDRELSKIRPSERTTPAGRFVAAYGSALGHKQVLWVDYGTALSLHPLPTTNTKERRAARLKSPSPADNRITFGCINVSAAFYRDVVRSTLVKRGVVYILPEQEPLAAVLPRFVAWRSTTGSARSSSASDGAGSGEQGPTD